MGFDEGHMEGTHNFMGRAVVAAVGFGITTVANKNAFHGTLVDLGVVPILNEHEGTDGTQFPEVERRQACARSTSPRGFSRQPTFEKKRDW